MATPNEPVTLENCDREPIHVPGSIQPHGALIALDRLGRVTHASANVADMLGADVAPGGMLRPGAFESGRWHATCRAMTKCQTTTGATKAPVWISIAQAC